MIKLTATHLSILAAANDRDDGVAVRPEPLKPAAATKMAARLVEHGLCREVRAKAEMPIWREDEQGKPLSLKILKAGRLAVPSARQTEEPSSAAMRPPVSLKPDDHAQTPTSNGNGSKQDLVVAMMQRQGRGYDRRSDVGDRMVATHDPRGLKRPSQEGLFHRP